MNIYEHASLMFYCVIVSYVFMLDDDTECCSLECGSTFKTSLQVY